MLSWSGEMRLLNEDRSPTLMPLHMIPSFSPPQCHNEVTEVCHAADPIRACSQIVPSTLPTTKKMSSSGSKQQTQLLGPVERQRARTWQKSRSRCSRSRCSASMACSGQAKGFAEDYKTLFNDSLLLLFWLHHCATVRNPTNVLWAKLQVNLSFGWLHASSSPTSLNLSVFSRFGQVLPCIFDGVLDCFQKWVLYFSHVFSMFVLELLFTHLKLSSLFSSLLFLSFPTSIQAFYIQNPLKPWKQSAYIAVHVFFGCRPPISKYLEHASVSLNFWWIQIVAVIQVQ